MAKKKQKFAVYTCTRDCTFEFIAENGEKVSQLFRAANFEESMMGDGPTSMQQEKQSATHGESTLTVPQGEIVCHHFQPENEVAEDDRDAQMENPQNFIQTERDLILIAEIMAHAGGFSSVSDAKKELAALLPEGFAEGILPGDADVEEEKKLKEIMGEGTEQEQRKRVLALLKENEVKGVFPAWKPRRLAQIALENGLG